MNTRSRQRLLDSGVSRAELRSRLVRGELHRLRHGIYTPRPPVGATERQRALIEATWPSLRPGAVLSHFSAAAWYGWPVPDDPLDQVWITRAGSSGGRTRPGVVRLVRWTLGESDVATLGAGDGWHHATPLLITTPERTLADVLRRLDYARAVVVADAALRSGVDRGAVGALVDAEHSRHRTQAALAALRFADPLAESPGESRSRVLMAEYGLPRPVLQYEIRDRVGLVGRGDFGWLEQSVIGEFDGRVKYGSELTADGRETLWREKQREDRIRAAGWRVVRWVWADLNRPEQLIVRLRDALL